MNARSSSATIPRTCPLCGASLPAHLTPDQCPRCLLKSGLSTLPGEPGPGTEKPPAPVPRRPGLPQPDDTFGQYRIVRLIGQGGMGAVFEAEELESGRRVALKLLSHALDSPEARGRFFREGRLAASVNHPNSVYVFGTDEVAGTPVIAMELVAGGTLLDRVRDQGPLPFGKAVDAILEIISGLEAAQRIGILHRDVKPSNCFLDADGTVKIGDFGLSISQAVRTEPALTTTGAFLGTPAFSSPEQLRGDELTVRSDIYAVGVTLYFLLTGRPPFAGANVVQLLATVLERPAESPARWQPSLPSGLCQAVLRCLDKDPGKRFASYAELRSALRPFASKAPAPANLGLRFLAGWADSVLLSLPQHALALLLLGGWDALTRLDRASGPRFFGLLAANLSLALLYYGLIEGLSGASVGKRLCRLCVVRADRDPPGIALAALRALVYHGLPTLPLVFVWGLLRGMPPVQPNDWRLLVAPLLSLGLGALLFAPARRLNGFAACHDRLTGTRVVARLSPASRPLLGTSDEVLPDTATLPQVGPYHVLGTLDRSPEVEMLLGFDARLLRRVWIRKLPPGSPPLATALRSLGRPGRLRWLAGRRTATEAWDAYEAVPGQPLLRQTVTPQGWDRVRFWLLDLARELEPAGADSSAPARLELDRVWVTADGRAKLLDFTAPGLPGPSSATAVSASATAPTPRAFLAQVARCALEGRPPVHDLATVGAPAVPLPGHARRLLEALSAGLEPSQFAAQLESGLHRPDRVTRGARLALFAACVALPFLALIAGLFGQWMMNQYMKQNPEFAPLRECLTHLAQFERRRTPPRPGDAENQRALETYIAGRFRGFATNTAVWEGFLARSALAQTDRHRLETLLASRPQPSDAEFADARATVERFFGKSPDAAAAEAQQQLTTADMALILGYSNGLLFVTLPSLLAALLFRGGPMPRLLGLAVVRHDGASAGRLRLAWRTLAAWLPFILTPVAFALLKPVLGTNAAAIVTGLVVLGLGLLSALLTGRSLQDRVAGTHLVPR